MCAIFSLTTMNPLEFVCDMLEILAAYQALPQLSKQPVNTIYNAKRFIGKRYT